MQVSCKVFAARRRESRGTEERGCEIVTRNFNNELQNFHPESAFVFVSSVVTFQHTVAESATIHALEFAPFYVWNTLLLDTWLQNSLVLLWYITRACLLTVATNSMPNFNRLLAFYSICFTIKSISNVVKSSGKSLRLDKRWTMPSRRRIIENWRKKHTRASQTTRGT